MKRLFTLSVLLALLLTGCASASSPSGKNAPYILYTLIENQVTTQSTQGMDCHAFLIRQYLGGGYILPDGSENTTLFPQGYLMSGLTSKQFDSYFYISSSNNPVSEMTVMNQTITTFNWDVAGQTLWEAPFEGDAAKSVSEASKKVFPGGVRVSPGNAYLLYPMTHFSKQQSAFTFNNSNPFLNDSSLVIRNMQTGKKTVVLRNAYNRQLLVSFSDFSGDGKYFYTIRRKNGNFEFVRITLETGEVTPLSKLFPKLDWSHLNWDDFFPSKGDAAYATFSLSPDETRIFAFKSIFELDKSNPCSTNAYRNQWVFDLEKQTVEKQQRLEGYVSDASWKGDSSTLAIAVHGHGGCYPDYMDSSILLLDKDGRQTEVLVEEPKSKITQLGWSPDDSMLAYDVYGVDRMGRLKVVEMKTHQVTEILNIQDLNLKFDKDRPTTIIFSDWVLR